MHVKEKKMPKYKGESEDNKLLKEVGINPNTLKFTPDSYTLDKNGKIKSIKYGRKKEKLWRKISRST